MELNYLQTLVTLASLHLTAAVSPGPSVLFVAHASSTHSRKAGLLAAMAMGVGVSMWAFMALFGLDVLIDSHPSTYVILQILCPIYLVWLAMKMIFHSRPQENKRSANNYEVRKIFKNALQLQLMNPKVMAFFASIFLTSVPLGAPLWFKLCLLGVIFLNEFLWYSFLAVLLSTKPAQVHFIKYQSAISVTCGTLLCFGALEILRRIA